MSDLDRYQYGYDQNSNRLYKANVVGTAAVGYLDEAYTYDNLNRLTQMQRGNLSGGVITGTPSREMDYTLDPTGNWSAYLTKTSGTTDLNQTRSVNTVNEITAIGGTPAWATPPAYDAAGNMTSFPQPATPSSNFTATYDAWNRMVSINNSGGSVATYQYDGRGRRIVKNTVATSETRHFYYTNAWQDIEERVGTSTSMDQQYVWGVRYIDELVCRDDATPQRLYAMQDANFNLTSIADTSGAVVERYLFDPYGNRTVMNATWGTISSSAYDWVVGHQGLLLDEESGLVYNRARFLSPILGRFIGRDPIGYQAGVNLYEYIGGSPLQQSDAFGFAPAPPAPPAPPAITPKQTVKNAVSAERTVHNNYIYFSVAALNIFFANELQAVTNLPAANFYFAGPAHPLPAGATALTSQSIGGTITMIVSAAPAQIDVVHEVIHVMQFQGGFSGNAAHDEAEAYGVAQAGMLVDAKAFLQPIEKALAKNDCPTASALWKKAWGPAGFPGIIGFNTTQGLIANADILNIKKDLSVVFSCAALAKAYNTQFTPSCCLTCPPGLPTGFA